MTTTLAVQSIDALTVSGSAQQKIAEAWRAYQVTEKYGLEFGRVCYEFQQEFAEQGKRVRGQGVSPILDELGIPKSTAYFWIRRYKESEGIVEKSSVSTTPTDCFAELYSELSPLMPVGSDGQPRVAALLEQATTAEFDDNTNLRAVVAMLRQISEHFKKSADVLAKRIQQ